MLGLSFIGILVCAWAGVAHYRKAAWGDPWHPIGWLLGMLFLLIAFSPSPAGLATGFRSLVKPKTAFFLFWILFFILSHLWNFRTAPWNGDALFDESGWDLWYLKSYVIGHPYQPAWYHIVIARETLFHYYVWGFLKLFGFNILAYQAALFVIWLTTYGFTLLLVDLFFESVRRDLGDGADLYFSSLRVHLHFRRVPLPHGGGFSCGLTLFLACGL